LRWRYHGIVEWFSANDVLLRKKMSFEVFDIDR